MVGVLYMVVNVSTGGLGVIRHEDSFVHSLLYIAPQPPSNILLSIPLRVQRTSMQGHDWV